MGHIVGTGFDKKSIAVLHDCEITLALIKTIFHLLFKVDRKDTRPDKFMDPETVLH